MFSDVQISTDKKKIGEEKIDKLSLPANGDFAGFFRQRTFFCSEFIECGSSQCTQITGTQFQCYVHTVQTSKLILNVYCLFVNLLSLLQCYMPCLLKYDGFSVFDLTR